MIQFALTIAALIVALIDEFQSAGKSLLGWAVILLAIAFLWGRL
jgi:hypothetical protein